MRAALLFLAFSGAALAQAPVPPEVEQAGRTEITRAALEAPIRFLAAAGN